MRPSSTQLTSAPEATGPDSGGRLLPVRAHQLSNPVRLLGALADPIVDPRQIQLQLRLAAAGDGVEETHVLKAQAALTLTAVGDDYVIERLIAPAASR